MTDTAIYETGAGGDMVISENDIELSASIFGMIYLSLFGGNVDYDPTSELNTDWWGNSLITEEADKYRSETEKALRDNALTSAGLSAIEQAAARDLRGLSDFGDVEVSAALLGSDKLRFHITIKPLETGVTNSFELIWDATKNELITNQTI